MCLRNNHLVTLFYITVYEYQQILPSRVNTAPQISIQGVHRQYHKGGTQQGCIISAIHAWSPFIGGVIVVMSIFVPIIPIKSSHV